MLSCVCVTESIGSVMEFSDWAATGKFFNSMNIYCIGQSMGRENTPFYTDGVCSHSTDHIEAECAAIAQNESSYLAQIELRCRDLGGTHPLKHWFMELLLELTTSDTWGIRVLSLAIKCRRLAGSWQARRGSNRVRVSDRDADCRTGPVARQPCRPVIAPHSTAVLRGTPRLSVE